MILLDIPKPTLVKFDNEKIKSPNASLIGENYVNYLINLHVIQKLCKTDCVGCQRFFLIIYKNKN